MVLVGGGFAPQKRWEDCKKIGEKLSSREWYHLLRIISPDLIEEPAPPPPHGRLNHEVWESNFAIVTIISPSSMPTVLNCEFI
jgi:hypothetical protein